MPTPMHISFVKENKTLIREPILIVASKIYDYDQEDYRARLEEWGFQNITGIDLDEGEGVDQVVDITDIGNEFIVRHEGYFATILCMEILTNVCNPFAASENVTRMLKKTGMVFLSECIVRKISRMPVDLWRFTYEGFKVLFSDLQFEDQRAKMFYTRKKKSTELSPLSKNLPEILTDAKHADESQIGFLLRRIHRKFFAGGIFRLTRFLPETTICAVAKKAN